MAQFSKLQETVGVVQKAGEEERGVWRRACG